MKKNSGMTLVEILIGMGLTTLISLAMSQVFMNSLRSQRFVEYKYNLLYFHNNIVGILSDNLSCINTFGGPTELVIDDGFLGNTLGDVADSTKTITPSSIKDSNGVDLFTKFSLTGATYEGNSLAIDNIVVTSYQASQLGNAYNGKARAIITYRKLGNSLGPETTRKEIILTVTVHDIPGASFKKIKNCRVENPGGSDSYWEASSSPGDIYYNIGKVGVGTSLPQANLDVNGGIKIGNTATCISGMQRYLDAGNGMMQFCDKTGVWRDMYTAPLVGSVDMGNCVIQAHPEHGVCSASETMQWANCPNTHPHMVSIAFAFGNGSCGRLTNNVLIKCCASN